MELNDKEIEIGISVFTTVLRSIKKHCLEHEVCENCVFVSKVSGHCVLDKVPEGYDIEDIEVRIRKDIEEEIKNGIE